MFFVHFLSSAWLPLFNHRAAMGNAALFSKKAKQKKHRNMPIAKKKKKKKMRQKNFARAACSCCSAFLIPSLLGLALLGYLQISLVLL
jgi:cell division septal protein FtsQ